MRTVGVENLRMKYEWRIWTEIFRSIVGKAFEQEQLEETRKRKYLYIFLDILLT
jgi:hypothetical protein